MSLAESQRSTSEVSLASLGGDVEVTGTNPLSYTDLAVEAVRGGWPALLSATFADAVTFNRSYIDDLCSSDIPLATGVRHDSVRMRRLLGSISRNIASEATLENLARDVSADGGQLNPETVRTYLDALTRVFALEELPAWSVALRSRSRLRTSSKLHLADPALALSLIHI